MQNRVRNADIEEHREEHCWSRKKSLRSVIPFPVVLPFSLSITKFHPISQVQTDALYYAQYNTPRPTLIWKFWVNLRSCVRVLPSDMGAERHCVARALPLCQLLRPQSIFPLPLVADSRHLRYFLYII